MSVTTVFDKEGVRFVRLEDLVTKFTNVDPKHTYWESKLISPNNSFNYSDLNLEREDRTLNYAKYVNDAGVIEYCLICRSRYNTNPTLINSVLSELNLPLFPDDQEGYYKARIQHLELRHKLELEVRQRDLQAEILRKDAEIWKLKHTIQALHSRFASCVETTAVITAEALRFIENATRQALRENTVVRESTNQ